MPMVGQCGTFSALSSAFSLRRTGSSDALSQLHVIVASGSTYPMISRHIGTGGKAQYMFRGLAYLDGVVNRRPVGTNSVRVHMI